MQVFHSEGHTLWGLQNVLRQMWLLPKWGKNLLSASQELEMDQFAFKRVEMGFGFSKQNFLWYIHAHLPFNILSLVLTYLFLQHLIESLRLIEALLRPFPEWNQYMVFLDHKHAQREGSEPLIPRSLGKHHIHKATATF